MYTEGIDVSKWQTDKQLDEYLISHTEVRFIVMKATEGKTYVDPKFLDRFKKYADKGYIMGAYHFAREDNGNGAIIEAAHFCNTVKKTGVNCFLVLDLEGNSQICEESCKHTDGSEGCSSQWVELWLKHVTETLKTRPMLYCGRDFTKKCDSHIYTQYGLWLAAYIKQKPVAGKNFFGWKNMTMWQYTSNPLDKDTFYGSTEALKKFVMPVTSSTVKQNCGECGRPL